MKPNIKNVGELKKAGYKPETIKQELRRNLVQKLKANERVFEGVLGYEDTVVPAIERAILASHHINLLGLRGQAKTRIARQMIHLLDEWIPVIMGSELNEDPLNPITSWGINKAQEEGDNMEIDWLHKSERYVEKLATPDVSVADLIGDIDPIKAATLKLSFAHEAAIHYGLIPRSHRCLFVINELPDLQPRIQVALFNILQEGDVQIRGFKLRLPLDLQFVFTANPEDYTNRGSIITPLKDRIGSQILTHYPKSIEVAKQITSQEARLSEFQKNAIHVPGFVRTIVENIAFKARESEYVDAKSGVSARLSITAYENLLSTAERRMLLNNEPKGCVRIVDLIGVIPAITGKVEMVYEGELEGPYNVANALIGQSIRQVFETLVPQSTRLRKKGKEPARDKFKDLVQWFADGKSVRVYFDMSEKAYQKALDSVTGIDAFMENEKLMDILPEEQWVFKEFLLHGLATTSRITRKEIDTGFGFEDLISGMMGQDLNG